MFHLVLIPGAQDGGGTGATRVPVADRGGVPSPGPPRLGLARPRRRCRPARQPGTEGERKVSRSPRSSPGERGAGGEGKGASEQKATDTKEGR